MGSVRARPEALSRMSALKVTLVYPGDLDTRTGGYRYDKRMVEELNKLQARYGAENIASRSLQGDYPFPGEEQLEQANSVLARIDDGTVTLIDGLAYSVMPDVLKRHANRLKLVALIHHPLALETGLSPEQSQALKVLETQALSYAQHIITTSTLTAESLSEYRVRSDNVSAILPGTDMASPAQGSDSSTCRFLCVATLTPRKAHHVLLDALASLKHLDWDLNCVGSTERDDATYQALLAQRTKLGLDSRVHFSGELEDAGLTTCFNEADAFVLASYHEGYGMVLTEAIARALPIICTEGGAMAQTVPDGAGILVPSGNVVELSRALQRFLEDPNLRNQLSTQAALARTQLRSWESAAAELSAVLRSIDVASIKTLNA